jgi:hypothetical protein
VNATSAVRPTLSAIGAASLAAIVTMLLYVDPWGVPRIAAGIFVASFVVALSAGKYLGRRCVTSDRDGLYTFVVTTGPEASPVSRAPAPQSSEVPSLGR